VSFLKKSILVVDDDKSILRMLWRVLFKNGYEVEQPKPPEKPLIR
jgi:ActR/RegA family two-component response regulator